MSIISTIIIPLIFSITLAVLYVKKITRHKEDISDINILISYVLFTILFFPFFILWNYIYSTYFSFSFSWMSSLWKYLFN